MSIETIETMRSTLAFWPTPSPLSPLPPSRSTWTARSNPWRWRVSATTAIPMSPCRWPCG